MKQFTWPGRYTLRQMLRARDNPLRTERQESLAFRPVGWAMEDLLGRLREVPLRGAIVGAEGSGKSTLMNRIADELARERRAIVRARLNDLRPRLDEGLLEEIRANPAAMVLLDGAERLDDEDWGVLLRETRESPAVVVTAHLPTRLPTLVMCETTSQLFRTLLSELLDAARLKRLDDLPERLFAKHAGNLREAMRELYDHFADAGRPDSIC